MYDFRDRVFSAVALIPEGRVATYGQIAELAGCPGGARAVGNAIHCNRDPRKIPCHRIVCADGSLGSNYGMGGPEVQRRRLLEEGVPFMDAGRVDMSRCIVVEDHPLEPFLPENGRMLFLGSFPPPRTRWSMEFFYPNFQNDFWRIMGLIHFNDAEHFVRGTSGRGAFDKERITDFCGREGLAFFDTASRVCRLKGNASDEFLVIVRPSDISGMLRAMPMCDAIVTTGGKSSEEFLNYVAGKMENAPASVPPVGDRLDISIDGRDVRWWRMPSTSRAYPLPIAAKAGQYVKLFRRSDS